MVAYNFKSRFAPLVESGQKTQTLRLPRAGFHRHARPGDSVQLYTGMRTPRCRKLIEVDPVCIGQSFVEICAPELVKLNGQILLDLEQFALADGFTAWGDMYEFFSQQYGPIDDGLGLVLIEWQLH